ncbi:MAG: radical SAM protein [Ignisphaera sp.]
MEGYNPIELTEIVKKHVTQTRNNIEERKYYRFRGGRWYGGIATSDVVGCNLRCRFCWGWRYTHSVDKGYFMSPEEVFMKLIDIALDRGYRYIRLSGGEPTISIDHMIYLLNRVEETKLIFIVETNGIMIGYDEQIAKKLANYSRIIVRISFKGTTPEEFHRLTGASSRFFEYQFKALENLLNSGMKPGEDFYPAVMLSFTQDENYIQFKRKLKTIHPILSETIDEEYIILYPHVIEILNRHNLKPRIAFKPENIPEFMV